MNRQEAIAAERAREDRLRGTGRTRRALRECPPDTIYVVYDQQHVSYCLGILRQMKRNDVRVVPLSGARNAMIGRTNYVRIDHYVIYQWQVEGGGYVEEMIGLIYEMQAANARADASKARS